MGDIRRASSARGIGLRLAMALAATALTACKYNKETVPMKRWNASVRVPNQQRLVALAVDQAVEALDFKAVQGKTVSLEVDGVFPHSEEDLLGYVTAQVEGKLARAGVRVLHPAPVLVVPGGTMMTPPAGAAAGAGALTLAEQPDFRLLIGVSWAGIDIRDKVTTDEPLLTKQLGLGVGGLVGGTILLVESDSSFRSTFATLFTLGSLAGAAAWYWKKSPFPHMYTLTGRVRLHVTGVPTREGVAFVTEGKGESAIVIDERSPEGFMDPGGRGAP